MVEYLFSTFYAITGSTLNDAIDLKYPNEKERFERVAGCHQEETFGEKLEKI